MSNELPELGQADIAGLTEQQVATVFGLAQRQLECCEGLVKLEERLIEEARQEVAAAANAQTRSTAIRRLEFLQGCAERARARSRREAVRLALRAENIKSFLAKEATCE